jgi:HEPN domain-containing protein
MTNEEMAASALRIAGRVFEEAKRYRAEGAWNLVIRRCQEAVELSLKGLLRLMGLEVPKVHDVSGFLRRYSARLPLPVAENLNRIVRISRTLREEREISFYGDEAAGFAPEELYTEEDANKALDDGGFVLALCGGAIKREERFDPTR